MPPTSGPNSAKPTTGEVTAGVYNATLPVLVDGQACPIQLDVNGQVKVTSAGGGVDDVNIAQVAGAPPALNNPLPVELSDGTQALGTASNPIRVDPTGTTSQPVLGASASRVTASWTSATGGNTVASINVNGYNSVVVTLNQGSTITGGVVTFEASDDNTNWYAVQGAAADTSTIGSTYTLQQSTLKAWEFDVGAFTNFRVRLSTVISGSGTVAVGINAESMAADPVVAVGNVVQAAASAETSTVYSGLTALTPLFSTVVASSSGATTIIAAVASKKIRVLAVQLIANAAVNAKWQSHVTPTDITGLAYLAANGGYVLPFNPAGWFQTVAGEALDINLSGSVAVGGSITYVTV